MGLTSCKSSDQSISHTCSIGFKSGDYAGHFHSGDILRLKAFVYNVCTVKTGVVIHKQKFSTMAPETNVHVIPE
ncbi:hypothetical protein TNCV_282481 [Trichonephila clavipes]|nr:hypothetical protein TNCV_282481 [Trichonephila clavipes]